MPRLFADSKKLCTLKVGHNQLSSLPDEYDVVYLEELHFQHNEIAQLPTDLLQKAYRYALCTIYYRCDYYTNCECESVVINTIINVDVFMVIGLHCYSEYSAQLLRLRGVMPPFDFYHFTLFLALQRYKNYQKLN